MALPQKIIINKYDIIYSSPNKGPAVHCSVLFKSELRVLLHEQLNRAVLIPLQEQMPAVNIVCSLAFLAKSPSSVFLYRAAMSLAEQTLPVSSVHTC